MIERKAKSELVLLAKSFKAISVIGPRQSGKTTLVRETFPEKPYFSLENPDTRTFAVEDPRGFLNGMPDGGILDEVQRTPLIFSYLQEILDRDSRKGLFVLTGSNNFLMQENISQTLAGRIGYLTLLPFSLDELGPDSLRDADEWILKGGYPPVHEPGVDPARWLSNYIRTYVERDVRQIKNIIDLAAFDRFLRLLAGRIGQLLNMHSLAIEAGLDEKTVAAWISLLESSFVVFRLRPHHANYNKRMVKMPKCYFHDTGLACALLGIGSETTLAHHPVRGSLFENAVISELLKGRLNAGISEGLYFWRNHTGHEIDLIVESGTDLIPIEIKSGQTIHPTAFKGLQYFAGLTGKSEGCLIYGGEAGQKRTDGIKVLGWKDTAQLTER